MRNCRILHTQITSKIRMSTAAIRYEPSLLFPSGHFQYETWCFSDDSEQRSFQIIHGSHGKICQYYLIRSIKVHKYVSANLKEKFKGFNNAIRYAEERLAKEAVERTQKERKTLHHAHRKKVEGEAIVSFTNILGCTQDEAYELVKVIKNNEIQHIMLNY